MKRKRASREARGLKRRKTELEPETRKITHPVLSHYHQSLQKLGDWLGPRSRGDLRLLLQISTHPPSSTAQEDSTGDGEAIDLLNNVLVGHNEQSIVNVIDRRAAFLQFSQQSSSASGEGTGSSACSSRSNMSEVRPGVGFFENDDIIEWSH